MAPRATYALSCMLLYRIGRSGVCVAFFFLFAGGGLAGLCTASALTADQIIQRAVVRAGKSQQNISATGYTYTKMNVTEELDGQGKVKQRKERMFQVRFRAGATDVKLLEVDGHAPAQADLKFQAETQSSMHRLFGQPATGPDNGETLLTPELAARFDFRLAGEVPVNGRPSYEITFTPKSPEPPVHRILDRLLNRVSGTLWIDEEEFEIARADLKLDSQVDLLGGLIGCLRKLAYTMTRTRVAEGVWLHSFSSGNFEGRKLLDPLRIKMQSESMNFHALTP